MSGWSIMGNDMFLFGKLHMMMLGAKNEVSIIIRKDGNETSNQTENPFFIDFKGEKEILIPVKNIASVTTYEATWCNANAIHNWFVQNVMDGVDDCDDHYVSSEQIQALIDACKKVLNNPELASELLPVNEECHGTTEYDEWYFKDLNYTVDQLVKLEPESSLKSYFYSCWW